MYKLLYGIILLSSYLKRKRKFLFSSKGLFNLNKNLICQYIIAPVDYLYFLEIHDFKLYDLNYIWVSKNLNSIIV